MYIKVKVQAGAKKEKIEKKSDDRYIVSVKEPALRNLANNRICEIFASLFGINKKLVRIISGHTNPSKIISVNIPDKKV